MKIFFNVLKFTSFLSWYFDWFTENFPLHHGKEKFAHIFLEWTYNYLFPNGYLVLTPLLKYLLCFSDLKEHFKY